MNDVEQARSALDSLDPSCSREEWIKIGMSAKSAGLSFDDFHSWSKNGGKYSGENDCKNVWKSFDENGEITASTLFHKAREKGWKNAERLHFHLVQTSYESPNYQNKSNNEKEIKVTDNSRALEIWKRCLPALATHEYIISKRGKPEGLRYYPSTESSILIGGIDVTDYLVVPCLDYGKLQTLQFIPPSGGKKLNLDKAEFNNGYFVVGDINKTTQKIYITESIGNAWALSQADNASVVVTFGSSRMSRLAEVIRAKYSNAILILIPDRGGECKAAKIASEIGCQWVELPQDKPSNYDVNDYAYDHSYDSLTVLLAGAKSPELRYKLLSVDDLCAAPPMEWIVKGLIPKNGLAALYGPSGSGKSFLLLDLALAIATGEVFWFGRRIKSVPITYVCLEGESGLGKRVKAWFTYANKAFPKLIRFITQPFNLLTDDVDELAKAIVSSGHTGGMIILDTLNRAAPGADENSPVDMGKIISSSSKLQRLIRGMVLLAHHTGKDETKQLRGHSSLPAALDGAIEVKRTGAGRQWLVVKSKDDQDGDAYSFKLEVVPLGIDEDGDAVTSCAVVPCENNNLVGGFKAPKSGNQKIIWDALGNLFKESKFFGKGGAPAIKACVEYDIALESTMIRLPCEKSRQKERAKVAITALVSNGFLSSQDGWLWVH